jgi:hypothetical protein
MEKVSSADPVMGPTENKIPTTMYIKHDDMPGLDEAALGTRVKFTVTGKITANRAGSDMSDGEATIEVISIEDGQPEKKKNAATMHLADLKAKLPKVDEENPKEEKDKKEEKE